MRRWTWGRFDNNVIQTEKVSKRLLVIKQKGKMNGNNNLIELLLYVSDYVGVQYKLIPSTYYFC